VTSDDLIPTMDMDEEVDVIPVSYQDEKGENEAPILIAKLRKNQEIYCTCIAKKGKFHKRFKNNFLRNWKGTCKMESSGHCNFSTSSFNRIKSQPVITTHRFAKERNL
jgi:hypothetical protein